ncbi:hypothetical protein LQR31_21270 [Chromobacterium vaccinii]|uniref:hypothetical protein n=1 Tax=Chromobacterium vaccinii TaxID=1108595 RepID=UPI001E59A87E|nr:hypothetical protein [Chromobacterium vaccinii]MCD4487006.1 hypothetical protein [Chromobacterium vaccinii]
MNKHPSLCQLLFGWELSELENSIRDSEYFAPEWDEPSTATISLQELLSALQSGLERWELYADARQYDELRRNMLNEVALFISTAQKFHSSLFRELDDNDLSTGKMLYAFFSSIGCSDALSPRRSLSVPEQVQATIAAHYPPIIANLIAKLPESLVYSLAAIHMAAQGLFYLQATTSHQPWLFGPQATHEHMEIALLLLGDARVMIQRMRTMEVLERASDGRTLPENAVIKLNDELGVMAMKSKNAKATKQKKQSAAARKRTSAVDPRLVIAAVNSGMPQKAVAIDYGLTPARVSQIMKEWRLGKITC